MSKQVNRRPRGFCSLSFHFHFFTYSLVSCQFTKYYELLHQIPLAAYTSVWRRMAMSIRRVRF